MDSERNRTDRQPRQRSAEDKSVQHALVAIVAGSVILLALIGGGFRGYIGN